jgi:hypothetical protein
MKNTLAAIAVITFGFAFGSNLSAQTRAAQSRSSQRTQVAMAGTGHMDLNTALVDLDRVSQATQNDIANLQVEKWKSGWKAGFLKDGSHKEQAQQAAGSLQRNLRNAMPGLIHDVQTSRGSMSATFKLYDDVSLVCEAVDSLISASEAAGKKSDSAPLAEDYSALTRIRRSLSAYIQQASAAWENKGRAPYAFVVPPPLQPTQRMNAPTAQQYAAQRPPATQSFAPQTAAPRASETQVVTEQGVKKIIVDDTIPEKRPAAPARKKAATTLTNL